MDQDAVGKLLPNLEITLGNDSDLESLTEEGEISDSVDDSTKIEKEKKPVDVVRTWMKTLNNPKVYENKAGAFITGLDLSSEALIKKLQDRAERFGLAKKGETITQKEIDALYKSLGIEPENLNTCKLKNIRLDALHMRGVEEMSTNDIFAYFGDYGPASVEWINDFSCNVVWMDPATTARAVIGMSRPVIIKKKNTTMQGVQESSTKEDEVKSYEAEDIIEMSDPEEDVCSDKKETDLINAAMEVDSPSDLENADHPEIKNDSPEVPSELINVPVPPGHWRLGVPHPKSKAILLRFATKDDKKLPGAEKRSHYYQKYGNPNYGGLKGLISSSRKRKMQAAKNRQVVEKFTEESTSQPQINSGETSKRAVIKASRAKMPRMRMYADDEEEKKKKKLFLHHKSERQSVHSRLGTKYTKGDLIQLGNRFSSESEEEDDNIPIHCTVPERFNIWTDIAKSMAAEDRWRPQSISLDTKPFDRQVSRKNWTTGGKSFDRDRRSPESEGRFWRPSSDESSKDLRSSLSYRRKPSPQIKSEEDFRSPLNRPDKDFRSPLNRPDEDFRSPLNRPDEDLRSKIKRIKKEDTVNKHRSPMFLDD